MKIFSTIITIILFFGSADVFAQFQNNQSSSGIDRRDYSSQNRNNQSNRKPVDYVKVMSDNLTDKLKLDGFQNAIVKNLIEDFIKKSNEIMQETIPQDAKVEKVNSARTTMETKFLEIFTDEQKILFEDFMKENTGKIEKKKKRKD